MRTSSARSMLAGVLVANSAPHLATALANRRHLTPLAGRESGPVINGVWAVANLVGAGLALRATRTPEVARWNADLRAFETGYLAFAAWMTASERLLSTNSGARSGRSAT